MTVKELIARLESMPPEAEVSHLWDGEARTSIEFVWLARDGSVVTSDYEQVCYSEGTRPSDAPTEKEDPHWETAPDPKENYED